MLVTMDCLLLGTRVPFSMNFLGNPRRTALPPAADALHPPCRLHCTSGLQPVLVHMSKNSKGTYSFDPISVNFLVEVAKALFALAMLLFLVSE